MTNIQAHAVRLVVSHLMGYSFRFQDEAQRALREPNYMPYNSLLGVFAKEATDAHNRVAKDNRIGEAMTYANQVCDHFNVH